MLSGTAMRWATWAGARSSSTNSETFCIGLAKLTEEDCEAVGIQTGQYSPEGLPGAGLYRRIDPGEFMEWRDSLLRLASQLARGSPHSSLAARIQAYLAARIQAYLAAYPHT